MHQRLCIFSSDSKVKQKSKPDLIKLGLSLIEQNQTTFYFDYALELDFFTCLTIRKMSKASVNIQVMPYSFSLSFMKRVIKEVVFFICQIYCVILINGFYRHLRINFMSFLCFRMTGCPENRCFSSHSPA